jgi:hypothetical protein
MAKINKKLDEFHYHEALDRTYLINTMIYEFILNHPVIKKHKKVRKKTKKALSLLLEVYQELGNLGVQNVTDQ